LSQDKSSLERKQANWKKHHKRGCPGPEFEPYALFQRKSLRSLCLNPNFTTRGISEFGRRIGIETGVNGGQSLHDHSPSDLIRNFFWLASGKRGSELATPTPLARLLLYLLSYSASSQKTRLPILSYLSFHVKENPNKN